LNPDRKASAVILAQQKGWIGVDIGTGAVKLAQIERRGPRFELSEALVVKRREPWDAAEWSDLSPVSSVEEIRAGLLLGTNFSGRKAACTLPMALCDIRGLNIPAGKESERRVMVARELESAYEKGGEPREFDFWPIDLPGQDQQQSPNNVTALSVSQAWASRVANDLFKAKLACQVVDGLPLAMGRAVQMAQLDGRREPVAAVDWGIRRVTLCIILDGRPVFVRLLRHSGLGLLLRSVQEALAVSSDESQQLLTVHGLPDPGADADGDELQHVIADVATEAIGVFVDELNRTLAYLKGHLSSLVPSRLWLLGGGATVKNVSPYVSGRINVPVHPWRIDTAGLSKDFLGNCPVEMLGPAIALSSLAWAKP